MERWPTCTVIVAHMERNGEVGQGQEQASLVIPGRCFPEIKGEHVARKEITHATIREILRLHFESHLAPQQIGSICKVSKSTVQRYLERLKAAGLSWPLPADLDDVALERRLFPPPPVASPEERCLPDCAAIHRELKSRKNVTLQLLWEEYKQANPLGLRLQLVLRALPRLAAPS